MSKILGKNSKHDFYKLKYDAISTKFNSVFWRSGRPTNCDHNISGYYTAWVDDKAGSGNYFELDSNSLAVAAGLADENRAKLILNEIRRYFNYYVNSVGATRVLCGTYLPVDTAAVPEMAQNGGYWYIVSYFLAEAVHKYSADYGDLYEALFVRSISATKKSGNEGLNEWYDKNGNPFGGKKYSWSIAFPLYLNSLSAHPVIPPIDQGLQK